MEDKKKSKKEYRKKIYNFKDGKTIAIIPYPYDREEIFLLHQPDFIGVMNEEHKEELLEWLVSLSIRRLHCVNVMDEKKKEKTLRLLTLLLVELEP